LVFCFLHKSESLGADVLYNILCLSYFSFFFFWTIELMCHTTTHTQCSYFFFWWGSWCPAENFGREILFNPFLFLYFWGYYYYSGRRRQERSQHFSISLTCKDVCVCVCTPCLNWAPFFFLFGNEIYSLDFPFSSPSPPLAMYCATSISRPRR
jgi:hypothetical protein